MLNWKPTTTLRVGMLCLLLAILAPRLLHPASTRAQDLLDGVTGVFCGIAIGVFIVATFVERRHRA
jgi:hypothetical protein